VVFKGFLVGERFNIPQQASALKRSLWNPWAHGLLVFLNPLKEKAMSSYRNEAKDLETKLVKTVAQGVDAVAEKASAATEYVQDRAADIQEAGMDSYANLEKRIKKNPGQSIAIAFAVGILASFICTRR